MKTKQSFTIHPSCIFSVFSQNLIICLIYILFSPSPGYDEQEATRDGGAGAELRELQLAAAERAARGAQLLGGALPERQVCPSDICHS